MTPEQKAALERLRRWKDPEIRNDTIYDNGKEIWGQLRDDYNTAAELALAEHPADDDDSVCCEDCGRRYGDEYGFPDLIIPYSAWQRISTTNDDGGLLCPSCICKRLHDLGIRCIGAFASGPIDSVPEPLMNAMRRVENIELAIAGRNNAWSVVRNLWINEEKESP